MVGADDRQPEHAPDQRRGHPRRTRRAQVQHLVAALGQRLDHRRQRRHAHAQPRVERNVDLGHRAQPPVDVRIGPDHLDLEARHAALADLVERVRHAVHPADAVGHQRDPDRLALAARELVLLAPEEGRRRRVGNGRDAGGEDVLGGGAERVDVARGGEDALDRPLESALVAAPRTPLQRRVGEAVGLQELEQVGRAHPQVDRVEPGAQQGAAVLRAEVAADRAAAGVALGHHALDHPQDRARVRRLVGLAAAERADRQRHRRVRPLGRRALVAVGLHAPAAQVREELARAGRERGLGPGAPDVHARVIVAAADADAAVGLDVDRRGMVELRGARAVAHLPDLEELRQPAPVARQQRRLDGVERMRQRGRDLVLVQVLRDHLDVVGVRLQPRVIVRRDPVTEDVHGLRFATEARGQFLRHEDVRPVGDLENAVDRVVVGDRDEVHPAALGQRVDLLGRRRTLRQAERALDAELRDLGCRGVAVEVRAAGGHEPENRLSLQAFCDQRATKK